MFRESYLACVERLTIAPLHEDGAYALLVGDQRNGADGGRFVDQGQFLVLPGYAGRIGGFREKHRVTLIAGFLHGPGQSACEARSHFELRRVGHHVHYQAFPVVGPDADALASEK